MVILLPKIGQRHFGACASHGHNLAIFHPFGQTKITFSSRRIEWNKTLSSISLIKILVFGPHFCSKASHGQYCTQIVGTCPGHHGQLISQNCVLTKIRGVPPPSLIKQAGIIIHTILNLWETPGIETVTSGLTSVYKPAWFYHLSHSTTLLFVNRSLNAIVISPNCHCGISLFNKVSQLLQGCLLCYLYCFAKTDVVTKWKTCFRKTRNPDSAIGNDV